MKKAFLILALLMSALQTTAMEPKKLIAVEDKKVKIKKIKIQGSGQNAVSKLPPDLQKYLIPFFSSDEVAPVERQITRKKIIMSLYRYLYLIGPNASGEAGELSSLEEHILRHTGQLFGTAPLHSALKLGTSSLLEWLKKTIPLLSIGQLEKLLALSINNKEINCIKNLHKCAPFLLNHTFTTNPAFCVGVQDTAIIVAARKRGGTDTLQTILALGATNINNRDSYGQTALINAACSKNEAAISLLLASHADPNIQDEYGRTALMAAFASYFHPVRLNLTIINSLIAAGTHLNHIAKNGETALFFALDNIRSTAFYNNHEILTNNLNGLKLLLDAGAHVNIQNSFGDTPLLYAVKNNSPQMVKLLLHAGAYKSLTIKNQLGESPLSIAFTYGDISDKIKSLLSLEENSEIDSSEQKHE